MKLRWENQFDGVERNITFGRKLYGEMYMGKRPTSIIVTHGEIEHYKNINGGGTVGEIVYVKYMNECLIPALATGGTIEIADTNDSLAWETLANGILHIVEGLGLVDYHKNKSKINNAKKIDKECALYKHKISMLTGFAFGINDTNYNKKEKNMGKETKTALYRVRFLKYINEIAGRIATPAEMLDLLEEEFNRCYDAGYEDGLFYDFPFDDDEDRDNEPRCYVDEDC